jgi:hypothetical protein
LYCPNCGVKITGSALDCPGCEENISQELKFHKKKIYFKFFIYVLGAGILLLIAYLFWGKGSWYSVLFFIVIYSALYYFLINRRLNFSVETLWCPQCQEKVPMANFCIECGKDLRNVLGYYQGSGLGSDIEISPTQLIVYRKRRDKNANYRRYNTENFDIDKIKNLNIAKCRLPLSKVPCLIFEYGGIGKKFQISTFMIHDLEDVFSTEIFQGTDFYIDY